MKIIRINISTKEIRSEELAEDYLLTGNRALIAKMAYEEIKPKCNALGPNNKLIFAVSPLEGLGLTSTGRLSVGCKSPLTGGIKEANGGGVAGSRIAKQGIRAIVVDGITEKNKFYILHINKEGIKLLPADDYVGKGTYETTKMLLKKYGEKSAIISIGQSGEQLLLGAGVFINDMEGNSSRACARGGVGAVMGSKGLKAIVIENDGTYKPKIYDEQGFKEARQIFHKTIINDPMVQTYTKYGTMAFLMPLNALCGMPTYNFRQGSWDQAEKLSGDLFYDLVTSRGGRGKVSHACMPGCIIQCSNVFVDEDDQDIVAPLEYESACLLGPNLGIDDIDHIGRLTWLCNDYGVDTVEIGVALGVAAEAGVFAFGDGEAAEKIIHEIGEGTTLGKVIGSGAATTGRVFGNIRVPAVKGQAMAAHEPRGVKSMSVTYAMTPMGADHTAGVTFRAQADHHSPVGAMELSRNQQVHVAFFDSFCCVFVSRGVASNPQLFIDLINKAYGTDFDTSYISELGKSIIKYERVFNEMAGTVEESVPEFMTYEAVEPAGLVSDISKEDYEHFWDESFWGSFPPIKE